MKRIFALLAAFGMALSLSACSGDDMTTADGDTYSYKLGMAAYTHTDGTRGYSEDKNGRAEASTTYVSAVFDKDGKIMDVKIDEVESAVDFDGSGSLVNYSYDRLKSKKELGDSYGMKAYSSIGKEWYEQVEYLENWLKGKKISDLDKASSSGSSSASSAMSVPATDSGSIVSGAVSTINSAAGEVKQGAENLMDGAENMMENLTGFGDEDLKAGVTIDTSYMKKALQEAYDNAK